MSKRINLPNAVSDGLSSATGAVMLRDAVAVAHTGTTLETTLKTLTIPPLTNDGVIRVHLKYTTVDTSTTSRNVKVRLGGQTMFSLSVSASAESNTVFFMISNRGSKVSQIGGPNFIPGLSYTTDPFPTASVDTSVESTLTITSTLASATDTLTLEAFLIEVYP